jgi:hypothetical protein
LEIFLSSFLKLPGFVEKLGEPVQNNPNLDIAQLSFAFFLKLKILRQQSTDVITGHPLLEKLILIELVFQTVEILALGEDLVLGNKICSPDIKFGGSVGRERSQKPLGFLDGFLV